MQVPLTTKVRHIALCLLLFGLFLLMPPAIKIFAGAADIGGVPSIVIYVFGIWAGLIIGAAALARHLGRQDVIDVAATQRPAPPWDLSA